MITAQAVRLLLDWASEVDTDDQIKMSEAIDDFQKNGNDITSTDMETLINRFRVQKEEKAYSCSKCKEQITKENKTPEDCIFGHCSKCCNR